MNHLLEFDSYARCHSERSGRLAERLSSGGGIWNRAPSELAEQKLVAVVATYQQVFTQGGKDYMFANGSLNDSVRNDVIELRLDHNPTLKYGDSTDAVKAFHDEHGVTVEVDLAKTFLPEVLARFVETDKRSSVSIGCTILSSHHEEINGKSVRVIDKAKMVECSLVREGAHPSAFACIMDKSEPRPSLSTPSSKLKAYASLHAVKVNLDNTRATLASMLCVSAPPRRAYTLADSNRWASAEHERLASAARARLH